MKNRTGVATEVLFHTVSLRRSVNGTSKYNRNHTGAISQQCKRGLNEVLSDTYTKHFVVKLVHTKGKWRNIYVQDTRATQERPHKKGQWGKIYPKVTNDLISML